MSEASVAATLFATLLIGAVVLTAGAALRPAGRAVIAETGLLLASLVAVGSTLGSLYFSERSGFDPCELCWYQRIAMYPQAVILPLAAWRGDRTVLRSTMPLSAIGLAIALYHVQLQLFPDQSSFCEVANPCTGRWIRAFDIVTIPQMAAMGFLLLLLLGAVSRKETA
jgi:disulfide bond formation protein DsbB